MADEQPIIVKKIVKKGHGGHHGGAWKVAYADFVTAMMALFMVLWIMSQGPEVREEVAAYFTDPKGIPIMESSNSLFDNRGAGMLDEMPSATRVGGGEGQGPDQMKSLRQTLKEQEEKRKLTNAGKQIMKRIMARPEISGLSDMVQVVVSPEGLRIEVSDQVEGTFFDLGSSQPKAALRMVLSEIVSAVDTLDNKLVIEGHTDARPYSNGPMGYTNWELSADRGNAVRRLLLGDGFDEDRIAEVRAYADRSPLPGTDPINGRNRRISILVQSETTGPLTELAEEPIEFEPDDVDPDPVSPPSEPGAAVENGDPRLYTGDELEATEIEIKP